MAYRTFRDSRGTEWQTWDVVPRLSERRVSDRRMRVLAPPHSDRRARNERRVVTGHRSVLTSGLDAGWLCFEADIEKRRLTPIPGDWMRCPVEKLEQYCTQASAARRTSQLKVVDVGD